MDGAALDTGRCVCACARACVRVVCVQGMMNNIAKPSTLPVKSDYHCFHTGIKSEWEDPQNRGGGKSVRRNHHADDDAQPGRHEKRSDR